MSDLYFVHNHCVYNFVFKDGKGPKSFKGIPKEDIETLSKVLDGIVNDLVAIVDSEPEAPAEGWSVGRTTMNAGWGCFTTYTLRKDNEDVLTVELSYGFVKSRTFTFRGKSDFGRVMSQMSLIRRMFDFRKDMEAMSLVRIARNWLKDEAQEDKKND